MVSSLIRTGLVLIEYGWYSVSPDTMPVYIAYCECLYALHSTVPYRKSAGDALANDFVILANMPE